MAVCLCAGGPDNQVHFESYQVSNQCMALVRDECLLPCKDAPELGFAKESTPEQYVPDVFYKVRAPECFCGAAARHTSGQDDRTSRHSSEAGCLESAQPDVVI